MVDTFGSKPNTIRTFTEVAAYEKVPSELGDHPYFEVGPVTREQAQEELGSPECEQVETLAQRAGYTVRWYLYPVPGGNHFTLRGYFAD